MAKRQNVMPSRKANLLLFSLLGVLLLVSSSAAAKDSKEAEAAALIARAAEVSNIRSPDAGPFRLLATFSGRVTGNLNVVGTYKLLWVSPSQWREEVDFPGYTQVRVGGGGKYWQVRNVEYEHMRVYQLRSLLRPTEKLAPSKDAPVKKIRRRKDGNEDMRCLERQPYPRTRYEECFDTKSGVLIRWSHSLSGISEQTETVEYRDHAPFKTKLFPRVIRRLSNAETVLEAKVEELQEELNPDPSLFLPPPGAKLWGHCEEPGEDTLINRVPPKYPDSAKNQLRQGEVTVYGVIETDGSLTNLRVIQTAGSDLDDAALEAVRQWKYEPPSCGGVPLQSEVVISVVFRLAR